MRSLVFLFLCSSAIVSVAGAVCFQSPAKGQLLTPSESASVLAGAPVECQTPQNTANNFCDVCGGPDGDGFFWKCFMARGDQDCVNWHNGSQTGWVSTCDFTRPGAVGCGGQKMKFWQAGCLNPNMGMWPCGRNHHAVMGSMTLKVGGCP